MPLYEYNCEDCDHEIEIIQKFTDPSPEECPKCTGSLKKKTSQSSFVLKGGGWYKEGYSSTPTPTKKNSSNKESSTKDAPKTDKPTASDKKEQKAS